jgi:chloramphenicol 3-O-phosphotransferase
MGAPPIVVVSGQLAAGKSTIARAVLDRFPLGVHIDVDALREMVTSGLASPLDWSSETTRQFEVALEAAAVLAAVYHRAGFAVGIEGAFDPIVLDRRLAEAGLRDVVVGVILHPPLAVALARNRGRTNKPFDPGILEEAIRGIDADLTAQPVPEGWTIHDNGDETVAATTEWVLAEIAARHASRTE